MTYESGTSSIDLNDRFIDAVRESYAKYNSDGARSPKKIRPLHQWVADEMQCALTDTYILASLTKDGHGKERKVVGKYYDKRVDIAISKTAKGDPIAIISVKFVASNFKQNANNYFEHLMGETANIRRTGTIVGHLMVLPEKIPYFNNKGKITHLETIKSHHLAKYIKLAKDENHPHKPNVLGVGVIDLHVGDWKKDNKIDHAKIGWADLNRTELDQESKDTLSDELSVSRFITTMKSLVEEKR